MNIPNRLTIIRTILVPVFIIIYLTNAIPYNHLIAAGIFVAASLTDYFDGYIARKYNMITNFGKFLDPLADKLLVNSALLCFLVVPDNPVPFWVVFVIIMRDFIINGFRLVASDNNAVIAADYWGKIKTTVQMVMVIVVLVDSGYELMNVIEKILIYASVILTVLSLVECLYKNRKVLSGSPVIQEGAANPDTNMFIALTDRLKNANMTISFAESCTGGLLCASFVDVPGSSAILKQSLVTYCDDAKMNIIGVSDNTIKEHTAVSEETAAEMAEGVKNWAASDIGVSITGIAGPDGGSEAFPVGLVYIGISCGSKTKVERFVFEGNRREIRVNAVNEAASMIEGMLS